MKINVILFLTFCSALPTSIAFTSLPIKASPAASAADAKVTARPDTKLQLNNYDSMSMETLANIANQMGYDAQGLDRVSLTMIAKGYGGAVKGVKTLAQVQNFQAEAARIQAERELNILRQREEASKYLPRGVERAQGRSSVFHATPNGSGFGDMSIGELERVANEMGYVGRGLDRADLIMIAKGYGNTVRGARTLRAQHEFEQKAKLAKMEREQKALEEAEEKRRNDFESMTPNQLRNKVIEMGFNPVGLGRPTMLMICKGYGDSIRGLQRLELNANSVTNGFGGQGQSQQQQQFQQQSYASPANAAPNSMMNQNAAGFGGLPQPQQNPSSWQSTNAAPAPSPVYSSPFGQGGQQQPGQSYTPPAPAVRSSPFGQGGPQQQPLQSYSPPAPAARSSPFGQGGPQQQSVQSYSPPAPAARSSSFGQGGPQQQSVQSYAPPAPAARSSPFGQGGPQQQPQQNPFSAPTSTVRSSPFGQGGQQQPQQNPFSAPSSPFGQGGQQQSQQVQSSIAASTSVPPMRSNPFGQGAQQRPQQNNFSAPASPVNSNPFGQGAQQQSQQNSSPWQNTNAANVSTMQTQYVENAQAGAEAAERWQAEQATSSQQFNQGAANNINYNNYGTMAAEQPRRSGF